MAQQPSSFGYWLRRRRKALDITQAALAARAGCVLTTIKKIETGARQPSRQLAERLADALVLSGDERALLLDVLESPAIAERPRPSDHAETETLPPMLSGPLIGRSHEVAALSSLLTRAETRLVTLVGPGGVGKTRLAVHLAADLHDVFVDGVWFVDLAPLSDPDLVAATIARALGLEPGTSPLAALTRALRDRHALLVLDNFEHVAAAAPVIVDLLAAAPNLLVLATSRMPLRLISEQEYLVPPLELPPEQSPHDLGTYAAVQLFIRRARAVHAHFALTPENGATIAAICRRLDGLPLAIELAAARIRLLSPVALLRRLDRRMALLTDGPRDMPARQQTLRATLDWSYRLLGAREQRIFARLGVFVGGATLEAIEVVCGESERGDMLPHLAILVAHSLLRSIEDAEGEPRFTMLETIREYALHQLAASGEEADVRARHADYYLSFAETAVPHLRGANQVGWLDWLEADHANMRAALEWLRAARNVEEALRLAGALHWFWDRRGYLSEGRDRLQTALAAMTNSAESSLSLQQARAWALVGAAALAFDQGDRAAVAALAEASAALFRQLDDSHGLALALLRLAFVRGMSDPQQARDLLAEARTKAFATGDPWFIGLAQFVSAQAALFGAGDHATARTFITEGLPAIQASGDPYTIAHGLSTLGLIDLAEGKLAESRTHLEAGLASARTLHDTRSIALLAAGVADTARCQGDYGRAAELYSESLALYHELGNTTEIPAILHSQGYVALGQGNLAAARDLFIASMERQHAFGNLAGVAEGLVGLAALATAENHLERAAQLFGAAHALREQTHGPVWPAEQFELQRHTAATRARLPAPIFERHWHAGKQLALDQAITYACGDEPSNKAQTAARGLAGLTAREREVAALVAQGYSNRAIAEQLVISERTVEHHIANMLAKLDVASRVQIATWAVAVGLVSPAA